MALPAGSHGLALVAVLWMTAALGLLVAAIMATTRADIAASAGVRDTARAAALGDAAIQLAVLEYRLDSAREPGPFLGTYTFEGEEIEVRIVPGNSFIDINTADHALLLALFTHAGGLAEEEAERLAERVVQWRTPGTLQELAGSERQQYIASGAAFRPRHGNFESVADLMQVLGVDLDTYVRIERLISVHESGHGVWPPTAPDEVLAVIAAGNREAVDAYVRARETDPLGADATRFDPHLVGGESTLVLHARASVIIDGRHFERVRWIDVNRLGAMGEPWATLQIEPVRIAGQGAQGR